MYPSIPHSWTTSKKQIHQKHAHSRVKQADLVLLALGIGVSRHEDDLITGFLEIGVVVAKSSYCFLDGPTEPSLSDHMAGTHWHIYAQTQG